MLLLLPGINISTKTGCYLRDLLKKEEISGVTSTWTIIGN